MRISISRIQLFQILLLVLSLAAAAFLLVPLKRAADERAILLKNQLLGQLENSLGIKIRYQSISPALLSVITIKELEIQFRQGDFKADTLKVFYNPLRRVRDRENDPVRMISRVTVSQGHLNLRLGTGKEGSSASPAADFDPWAYLADKSVSIQGLSADISVGDKAFIHARELSLNLRDDDGTVRYSLETVFSAETAGTVSYLGKIDSDISSEGTFSPAATAVNGRLNFKEIETDAVLLEPLAVDFTFSKNVLTARRVDDDRPLDLWLSYTPESWSVQGVAEQLNLRDMARPGPSGLVWDSWYSSLLDGRFALSGTPALKDVNYSLDLGISVPAGPVPIAWEAVFDLKGNLDAAAVDSIRISSRQISVEYSGNSVFGN